MKFTFLLFLILLILSASVVVLQSKSAEEKMVNPITQGFNEKILGVEDNEEDETKKIIITEATSSALLYLPKYMSQSFNNCGPANLAMILNFWGGNFTQEKLAEDLRPFNNPKGGVDDKSVYNPEMAEYAKLNGYESLIRPNGDIEKLKLFLANGIPVVVSAWLHENEDIGHYRIVKGFDEGSKTILTDDSYIGPNQKFRYDQFIEMWKPFNYIYLIVYPKEKSEIVNAILKEEVDQNMAYQNSIKLAEYDLEKNPADYYAQFNLATAHYHLGNFEKTIENFEKVETKLPPRMLWYQLEPVYAYQQLGEFQKATVHADKLLQNGNLAFSEMYQLKGEIYLKQGKNDLAKEMFEKAIFYNKHYAKAKESLNNL
jgi:tetratricopeptide (TPR) repeat protein